MLCKKCGSLIEDGDLFCGECGWDVRKPYPETSAEANQSNVFDSEPSTAAEPSNVFAPETPGEEEPSGFFSPDPLTETEPSNVFAPETPVEEEPSGFFSPDPLTETEPSNVFAPETPVEEEPSDFFAFDPLTEKEPSNAYVPETPVEPDPSAAFIPEPPTESDETDFYYPRQTTEPDESGKRFPYESAEPAEPADDDPDPSSRGNKPKGAKIALIVGFVILLLFAVITVLSITDFVSFRDVPVLSQYESFLKGLIGEDEEEYEPVYEEQTTVPDNDYYDYDNDEPQTVWNPYEDETEQTTVSNDSQYSYLPVELQPYADKLVPENRNYEITLEESNWNIMYRSSPEIANGNVICKVPNGTRIYVYYIYNGTWAAYRYDGHWGFSSLYAANDPSKNTLMTPVG